MSIELKNDFGGQPKRGIDVPKDNVTHATPSGAANDPVEDDGGDNER